MSSERKTPLTDAHRALGARLVDFAGYLMPLQYSGIVDEHNAVRDAAGLFDVSHMGQIVFDGPDAINALDRVITNDLGRLDAGQALYTPICQHDGGIVDDCVVYRQHDQRALVIVNAANIDKDFNWLRQHARGNCRVDNESDKHALLALQGPRADRILAQLAAPPTATLQRFAFCESTVAGVRCLVARTGYTGEDGFELLCPHDGAHRLWSTLLERGAPEGLKPCGLGARDTLRLEARLLLYGSDIDEQTSALEAGLAWTVKFDKPIDFIGRRALEHQRATGVKRRLCSLVMRSRGIARHGHRIYGAAPAEGRPPVGQVTSGTMSPTLKQAIALGYLDTPHSKPGSRVIVDARGRAVEAEVIKGPFYRRTEGEAARLDRPGKKPSARR